MSISAFYINFNKKILQHQNQNYIYFPQLLYLQHQYQFNIYYIKTAASSFKINSRKRCITQHQYQHKFNIYNINIESNTNATSTTSTSTSIPIQQHHQHQHQHFKYIPQLLDLQRQYQPCISINFQSSSTSLKHQHK